jgi:hypothetical protein
LICVKPRNRPPVSGFVLPSKDERRGICRFREANVKVGRITTLLAAAGMAMSPIAANAAASLSLANTAPAMSAFQDDEPGSGESNHGGGSTAVILGVLLIVLIGVAAISGNDHPISP